MGKARDLATFATSNSAGAFGFKNRIINGDFKIWQKGTARYSNSGAGGAAKYYADRWSSGQYQNAAFERVDRTGTGPTSKYAMRVSSSNAAESGSGTRMVLGQLIEHINCADLAGTAVTLSFWIRFSASSFPGYGAFFYTLWEQDSIDSNFDTTGATRESVANLADGSLPTTWTKLTVSGVTAATMKNLAARFGFTNLTTTASNGQLWYEITEIQVEKGSVATPFEFRSIGQELALCQRYYQQWGGNTQNERLGNGFNYSAGQCRVIVPLVVTMRATPSLSVSAAGHWSVEQSGGVSSCTAVNLDQASPRVAAINFDASGLVVGQGAQIMAGGTTAARLNLSAEL